MNDGYSVMKNIKILFKLLLVCCLTHVAMPQPLAASKVSIHVDKALGPTGRFCGYVFNAGIEVRSEVNFKLDKEGKISGTMIYRDQNGDSEGTIEELIYQAGLNRTVQWKDKYGYGFAVFNFDAKFESFNGKWGMKMGQPHYPWTGTRCDDFTS